MAEPVAIVVCGAAGRMGRRIVALAHDDPRVVVSGALEAVGHGSVGADAGELAGVGPLEVTVGDDLASVVEPGSVVVDFSTAEASMATLRTVAEAGAAVVIGSTGFSKAQRAEATELAAAMPTLIAPNMSLGVNVLISLVEDAVARLGSGFDCEIVELHHNKKKDAPSGTALALAEAAARATGRDPDDTMVLARQGMTGERRAEEIGVVAVRGGDAAGEHTVMLLGTGERIELIHRAATRDCFAAGAIRAARWLAGRAPGLYSMRDVIGL